MSGGASASSVALELPERTDPLLDELIASGYAEYVGLCRRGVIAAAETAFSEIEAMGVIRNAGMDKEGRVTFMFFPASLPEGCDLERISMYAVWLMHETVVRDGKDFTAVWVCNNLLDSRLTFWWFRSIYKMLPHAYHKQMRSICVVHPSIQVRLILFLLSYVVKGDIWPKLLYADRIEFLDEVLTDVQITSLPEEYVEYDKHLDKEMYATLDAQSALAGGQGGFMSNLNPTTEATAPNGFPNGSATSK